DTLVSRGEAGGRRKRVIRFELDHRPRRNTHREESLLEGSELRPERAIDSLAGLVAGPELIPERLDDVVRRDADVGCSPFEHLRDGTEYAGDGAEGRIGLVESPKSVKVTEQLVGAVDQVNDHWCPCILSDVAAGRDDVSVRNDVGCGPQLRSSLEDSMKRKHQD